MNLLDTIVGRVYDLIFNIKYVLGCSRAYDIDEDLDYWVSDSNEYAEREARRIRNEIDKEVIEKIRREAWANKHDGERSKNETH